MVWLQLSPNFCEPKQMNAKWTILATIIPQHFYSDLFFKYFYSWILFSLCYPAYIICSWWQILINDNFFYHNGKGLKRFQNSNRLSLEREQIFREIGGMRLIKTQRVGKNQNTVGHIFLDDKSSFIIKSNEDLLLADIMSKIN